MKSKSILAWHFVGDTLRDGSPVPPDGVKLTFTGPLRMCAAGFHVSRDPFDALQYAPGPILCRVRCGGTIIENDDKLVCSERTIISRLDATEGLRYFARMQALSVVHLYPDEPAGEVIEYLFGDESARSAAWSAAEAARSATARSAAEAAAEAARSAWSAEAAAAAAEAARSAAAEAARAEWNALVKEAFNG